MTTITIGIDGGNWDMVDEWIQRGELPNLRKLKEEGIHGKSISCLPPLTVPNWMCYATGKNPGKHDVFRFDRIDTADRSHVFHDATDFKSAKIWNYLNDEGLEAGIINMPSTYPPEEIDGFIVAGGPDASDTAYRSLPQGYTSPERIEDMLTDRLDYRVHPSPMISPSEHGDEEIEAILSLIDKRFEAAELLLESESPEFLHVTVFYNMALQHYFWRDEPVLRAWKRIDENLERIVDDDTDLMIMSDHGTCAVEAVFYINVWLAQNGYLAFEGGIDEWLRKAGITRERALSIAKRLNLVEPLSRYTPDRLQRIVPWEEGIKRDRVLSVIDWENTRAVASNQGPIYLNVNEREYEPLRDELIDQLTGLTHPETGRRLVDAVHRGNEHFDGPYENNAPDLMIEQSINVNTSDAIGPSEWYSDSGVWLGGNMPEGIVLCHGPSFGTGTIDGHARIVDLMPTLLHTMGAAVPSDVDGRVLDVFDEESDPESRSIHYRDPLTGDRESTGSNEGMRDRLVDLGYLE